MELSFASEAPEGKLFFLGALAGLAKGAAIKGGIKGAARGAAKGGAKKGGAPAKPNPIKQVVKQGSNVDFGGQQKKDDQ
jgi:hypothetical protein